MAEVKKEKVEKAKVDYIDVFQAALQEFENELKRDKFSLLSLKSAITDGRNEKARIDAEVAKAKEVKKAFDLEISGLQEKIEARKRELKELLNT